MQPSNYLKRFTPEGKGDYNLLFSTRHCSKALIHQETWAAMLNCTLSRMEESTLKDLGMLTQDQEEERSSVTCHLEELNKNNTILDIIAVMNLDCNFACKYCYEGDVKGRKYMSEDTAARLIDFIKNKVVTGMRGIHLDFYGGEPLLSPGMVRHIAGQLKEFAIAQNISFDFGMVTNGALLNRKTVEELAGMGLKNIKVTLDGPPHIHNMNRPFKSGAPSFEILVNNIKDTCDIARIAIGGNFEKDNYREFPLLLDYLLNEGLTPDRIPQVKFDPVMKRSERVNSLMEFNDGCISINEPWLMDAFIFLREEILKRGFWTPGIRPSYCSIESRNSYVVNHDGVLYKCPGFIGMEGFEAGDLENGPVDCSSAYKMDIWKNSECLRCEYLPLCFGGCRFVKFARDGRIDSTECQRKYFDICLEPLVKQDIKYGIKAET